MSQSSASDPAKPFHLSGNFAPVFDERTDFDLPVTGAIPPELRGRFFRNGANPQTGESVHWFMGNGMIHGVELRDGEAKSYRNRYVRTPLFDDPNAERISADGSLDRTFSCANTHVIQHGGRILALEEGSFPFEVDRELETLGAHDFDGRLTGAMTAHPRICPDTGELLFFGTGQLPPYLSYYRVAADGTLVQSEVIDVKASTMMHDWCMTRNHVVFMDLPMVFDLAAFAQGGLPIQWSDEYGARLGVMPRDGTNDDVVWYEIDPCYIFHSLNGYEEDGKLVLDVSRMDKLSMEPGGESSPSTLHRFTIDPGKGTVSLDPLDDAPADFPRVHDAVVGKKHRYGYLAGSGDAPTSLGARLYKYDLETGRRVTHELGAGCQAGEPVFVEAPDATGEDEGWVLTFVYDAANDSSDLVILDASHFDQPPVARIHMPRRVPFGFHGSWLPEGT